MSDGYNTGFDGIEVVGYGCLDQRFQEDSIRVAGLWPKSEPKSVKERVWHLQVNVVTLEWFLVADAVDDDLVADLLKVRPSPTQIASKEHKAQFLLESPMDTLLKEKALHLVSRLGGVLALNEPLIVVRILDTTIEVQSVIG